MTAESSSTTPLLIGEDNPYGSDPRYALYMEPPGSAGSRLCRVVLGVTRSEYLRCFHRVNLCSRKWNIKEARETAARLIHTHRRRVMLGAKVAHAFGYEYEPFSVYSASDDVVVILPHPSGRSRAWNDPNSVGLARSALLKAGILPVSLPKKVAEPVDASLAGHCSCDHAPCPHDVAGKEVAGGEGGG